MTAKISLIDIENTPKLSLRCILSIMSNLQQSTYVGQEWWDILVKLAIKHSKDNRMPFSVDEITQFLSILNDTKNLSNPIVEVLLKDLLISVEAGKLSYTQIYDILVIFYATRLHTTNVTDILLNYYVQKGYDEDELLLLGHSKAWKLLKAISVIQTSPTSQFSGIFIENWFKYISENYDKFSTIQLKRALDFWNDMDFFKQNLDSDIKSKIKEIQKFYEKKVLKSSLNSHGLDLEMSPGETILAPEDIEDQDPVFEPDDSDSEETRQTQINNMSHKELFEMASEQEPFIQIFKSLNKSAVNQAPIVPERNNDEFSDPKMKKLSQMIDQTYQRYGNTNKK